MLLAPMNELKPDDIELAFIIVYLMWTLDDHVEDPSIAEETIETGRALKMDACEELHNYYTRHRTVDANYALRMASLTAMIHAIDVSEDRKI